jgi:hypothetical protein
VSETPERLEREMFEIRSRITPDIDDLRKHLESQSVADQVEQTIGQRLGQAADRGRANLKAKQQEAANSTRRSLSLFLRKISSGREE